MKVGEALRKTWLESGVQLRPGASAAEVRLFETTFNVRLPDDFRDYLLTVNGLDYSDAEGFEFFGLDKIVPLSKYWSTDVIDGHSYFVFADYLFHPTSTGFDCLQSRREIMLSSFMTANQSQ